MPHFLSSLVRTCRGRGARERGMAPATRGAARAEPDGGASGRLLGEPESRRGGPPQPRLPPRGAPGIPAPLHTLTPGVEENPAGAAAGGQGRRPHRESGEPCPASRHFLSENGARPWGRRRRRSGRASSRLGSCCLPVRWGEPWRELPLAGRRVSAEGRTASARVRTRLGGDLAPQPGPHAGSRHAGAAARGSRLGLGAGLTISVHRASGLGDHGRSPRPPRNFLNSLPCM